MPFGTDLSTPQVYQHVWRDHSLAQMRSLVLTLKNWEGAILLIIYAPLLSFIQERCWIIIRHFGIKIWNPLRLPEMENPYDLDRLTQIGAILSPRRMRYHDGDRSKTVPRLFQVAATLNLFFFVTIGFAIPILLTGQFSTPVVQSRDVKTCNGFEFRLEKKMYVAQLADSYYKQCLYMDPQSSFCTQETGILGSTPELHLSRPNKCPFLDNACLEEVEPVRFEYRGLRPRDYGVNMPPEVLMDRRVTCAPLKTEPFLLARPDDPVLKSQIWFGRALHDPMFNLSTEAGLYGTTLTTLNGPNRYSNEYSGHTVANFANPEPIYDLSVYPQGYTKVDPHFLNENLHPYLQREDGNVFVILLRAGRTVYNEEVSDPLYASHEKIGSGYHVPDREATALGCVEQYNLCLAEHSICTNWSTDLESVVQTLMTYVNISGITPLAMDLGFIYPHFTSWGSMRNYFRYRSGSRVLLTSAMRNGLFVEFIDPKEQWIKEVQAWFVTGFLYSRYSLLQVVRKNGTEETEDGLEETRKICRLVLFQSSSYTNVDLIGLLVSVTALLLMWPFSTNPALSAIDWIIHAVTRIPHKINLVLMEVQPVTKMKTAREAISSTLSSTYQSLQKFVESFSSLSLVRTRHEGEANGEEPGEGESNGDETNDEEFDEGRINDGEANIEESNREETWESGQRQDEWRPVQRRQSDVSLRSLGISARRARAA